MALLPGEDLIAEGLADLASDAETVASLLVSIGAPRLRRLGVRVPRTFPDAEHRLYALLTRRGLSTAHSQYNAYLRRLVSYERALACAR
jgi:hypothetical protein